jgi:nitronate monooxygenase
MVANDERQTDLIFRTLHNTARVMRNQVSQEVVQIERAGGAKFEDVMHLVAGTRGRDALANGDTDGGIWSAGMVQGIIDDIPSCKDLIDRIISEAEDLIRGRLESMVASPRLVAAE